MSDEYANVEQWMEQLRNKIGSVNMLEDMKMGVSDEDRQEREIAERKLRQLENLVKDHDEVEPQLSTLTQDEKLDLLVERMVGDPLRGITGLVQLVEGMTHQQEEASQERLDLRNSLKQWVLITSGFYVVMVIALMLVGAGVWGV